MANDAVAEIRERIDIVDLVQGYVPSLKRTGRSFKGICPFHQEKTPSFVVFPDSQNFHCFGCAKGGDLFSFYMLVENTEFREALRELASRAGVTLESGATPAPELDAHRNRLVQINDLATTFYSHVLARSSHGEAGRTVVSDRNVSAEMVDRFRLGFAPDSWDRLLNFLSSRSVSADEAFEAGLLQKRDSGGFYDRFRNRLIFPIRDRDGQIVGFGGRAVGDGVPKYLNSPQTPVFDKSSLVYGLDLAKEAIRTADHVVIVEGYMDVIAAHQFGFQNVVGSMGTALTESQVGQIKRVGKRIVLALDADAAGQMAMIRGIETMRDALDSVETPIPDALGIVRFERKLKTEIAIVQLPEGKDPDELIRSSPDLWRDTVSSARPFVDFTIDMVTKGVNTTDAQSKSQAMQQLAPLLQLIPDRIVQGHYISLVARKLALEERLVLSEIRRNRLGSRQAATRAGRTPSMTTTSTRRSTEDFLIALLVKHPALTRDVIWRVPVEELNDTRNRELVKVLRRDEVAALESEEIILGLDDQIAEHADNVLALLEGRPEQLPGQVQREASQMLTNLGRERFEFLKTQLNQTLQAALDEHDSELLASVKEQIGRLAERHSQYYPPVSPYFLDSRSANHN